MESTILFAGIRFFAAGIITVLIYSIARRKLIYPKLKNMPKVLTASAFQTVIQYIFFYVGLSLTTGVVVLVYLSFLSAVAYAVWGVLLKYNPASKVSIYSFTTPVFGSILSYILLVGERDSINLVNLFVSLVVVSLGILLLNLNVNIGKNKKDAK